MTDEGLEREIVQLQRTLLDACAALQRLDRTPGLSQQWMVEVEVAGSTLADALDQCAECPQTRELFDDARELLTTLDARLVNTQPSVLARAS